MPSSGFKPRPKGSTVSVTNSYTGWVDEKRVIVSVATKQLKHAGGTDFLWHGILSGIMCDLSDVKRGMVIGARLSAASMSRTFNLLGVLRTTVPRVMTDYTNLGKVSSAKPNSGRKLKLKDRDRRVLKRIVAQNRKTTLPQITSEMNTHLLNLVSMKTIQREFHTTNIHGRVAIRKPLVSGRIAAKRLQW
ncbi:transposable element Tc1 transposase [Trichonephila clavipes]|nr:transposable element Tc1 transposase [Trichonephila clavipes]